MPDFEDLGRKIDHELENLRRFVNTELKPTTARKAVEVLRAASKRLTDLAQEIEARTARKEV